MLPPWLDRAVWEDFAALPYTRMVVAEAMRLYPQPPILIRRQVCVQLGAHGDNLHQRLHLNMHLHVQLCLSPAQPAPPKPLLPPFGRLGACPVTQLAHTG